MSLQIQYFTLTDFNGKFNWKFPINFINHCINNRILEYNDKIIFCIDESFSVEECLSKNKLYVYIPMHETDVEVCEIKSFLMFCTLDLFKDDLIKAFNYYERLLNISFDFVKIKIPKIIFHISVVIPRELIIFLKETSDTIKIKDLEIILIEEKRTKIKSNLDNSITIYLSEFDCDKPYNLSNALKLNNFSNEIWPKVMEGFTELKNEWEEIYISLNIIEKISKKWKIKKFS